LARNKEEKRKKPQVCPAMADKSSSMCGLEYAPEAVQNGRKPNKLNRIPEVVRPSIRKRKPMILHWLVLALRLRGFTGSVSPRLSLA
jgi:hypothetical protein